MKRLHLRRHSLKDGANDSIGPKGAALAEAVGRASHLAPGNSDEPIDDDRQYGRIFHGPLVRTMQTGYHFSRGLGYMPPIATLITGLGDQATFDNMVNDTFKAAVKDGKSNLDALEAAHHINMVVSWQQQAAAAVRTMFDQMADGETAVGFFHSPTIEMAVRALVTEAERVEGWDNLKELDGVVIAQGDDGVFYVKQVIRAVRD